MNIGSKADIKINCQYNLKLCFIFRCPISWQIQLTSYSSRISITFGWLKSKFHQIIQMFSFDQKNGSHRKLCQFILWSFTAFDIRMYRVLHYLDVQLFGDVQIFQVCSVSRSLKRILFVSINPSNFFIPIFVWKNWEPLCDDNVINATFNLVIWNDSTKSIGGFDFVSFQLQWTKSYL